MKEADSELENIVKKDISRLRSEVRNLKKLSDKTDLGAFNANVGLGKEINPFTQAVMGNYWSQTGMPWISSDGRKAVITEWFWQPLRGQPRRVDTNELRQFSQTFWINACVKTLIDEISSLEWDIIPKDGYEYEEAEENIEEVKDFLKYPNQNKESFNMVIRALLKDILELDAGCLIKVFNIESYDWDILEPKSGAPTLKPMGKRKLLEISARDGASFLKEADKFGYEAGYWQYSYQIPAHPMWFDKEEVIYIMEQKRSQSVYGFARTQAILDLVKSLHYSTIYNKRYFEETPIPDGALSLLDTNEAEMGRFMDMWNTTFKGQPHKLAVINKDIKWQPFNISNRELEFLETQAAYFKWVIAMFGLTPSELGITEDVNRATQAGQSELTKRKGIRPFLKLIEDELNSQLIPEFGYDNIEFTFVYDDPSEKAQRLNNFKLELEMGIRTPNEIRVELGLDPLPGGDLPQGLAMFGSPIGIQMDNRGIDQEDMDEEQGEEERDNNEEENDKKPKNKKESKRKEYKRPVNLVQPVNIAPVGQYTTPQQITQERFEYDPIMMGRLQREPKQPDRNTDLGMLDEIKCPNCGLSTLTEDSGLDSIGNEKKWRCVNCASLLNQQELIDNKLMENLYRIMTSNPSIKPPSMPYSNLTPKTFKSLGNWDFNDYTIKEYSYLDYTKFSHDVERFIRSAKYRDILRFYLEDLTEAERDKVRKILYNSIKNDLSINKIAEKLNRVIKDLERAHIIARTEVIRVVNQGNLRRMVSQGINKHEWIAAQDSRTCEICKRLDGRVLQIGQIFKDVTSGLSSDAPPIHVRCRCTTAPAIEL